MAAALLLAVPAAAATPSIRSTAEWLVDLGRDYALSEQVTGSDDDGLIILSYMQAAARIDETHADAYLWQYDMLKALGRRSEARAALQRYVELRPSDVSARLLWLGLSLDDLQTAEERTAFCRELLTENDLPAEIQSELQLQLAHICFGRMDEGGGSAALAAALAADPHNVVARRLLAQGADGQDASALPVSQMLTSLELNPLQPELVWAVGQQLDAVGLHERALAWYNRSIEQFQRVDERYEPTPQMLLEMATALASAGRAEEALAASRKVVNADPTSPSARLSLVQIAQKLKRAELAAEQLSRARELYEQSAAGLEAAADGARAAELTLFYAYYDPQPARASYWADLAAQWAPDLPLTKVAGGLAALVQGRPEQAIEALKPYGAASQLGAIGLARALIATDRKPDAIEVLRAAADLRRCGASFDEIVSLLAGCGQTLPPHPAAATTVRDVEAFDPQLFDLALSTRSCIKPVLFFEDTELTVAEPWRCRLTLTNGGPAAIHLGPGGLLSGQVLLAVRTAGDRERAFPAHLWLSADLAPVLRPGQSLELVQTIDIGPLRRELFCLPQTVQRIELTGIIDAVRDPAGQWVPSASGRPIPAAKATRVRVAAEPSDVARLTSGLRAEDAAVRIESAMTLAALVIEQQNADAASVGYERAPVDAPAVVAALLRQAIGDPMPHVRARLLDALRWYRLPPGHISALAGLLSDRAWLVRMTACSVLAEQQRHRFLPVLEGLSNSDPDPLLRAFTAALARRIRSTPPSYRP